MEFIRPHGIENRQTTGTLAFYRELLNTALTRFKTDQADGLDLLRAALSRINYKPLDADFEREVFEPLRLPSNDCLRVVALKWAALIDRLEYGWNADLAGGGGRSWYEGIL